MKKSNGYPGEGRNGEQRIQIQWHAVGIAFLRLGVAFGAGFLLLGLLNRLPDFKNLAQASSWIPKYIGDAVAFFVGMIFIWKMSQGRYEDYGFSVKRKATMVFPSILLGISFLPQPTLFVRATSTNRHAVCSAPSSCII